MEISLEDGKILSASQLVELAAHLQESSRDTQEKTAERLGKGQAQISKALNGASEYRGTCMEIISLYSSYEIEHPFFRLKRKSSER